MYSPISSFSYSITDVLSFFVSICVICVHVLSLLKHAMKRSSINFKEVEHDYFDKYLPIKNKSDLLTCVKENSDYFLHFLSIEEVEEVEEVDEVDEVDDLKQQNEDLSLKIAELTRKLEKLEELISLEKKTFGTHSCNTGLFDEKLTEAFLKQHFDQYFTIKKTNKNHSMDIIMKHKEKSYKIGVECKRKKTITQKDIDKFIDDSVTNAFKGAVFISKCSRIPKICEDIDTFILKGNKMYIYTNDSRIVTIVFRMFIHFLENKEESVLRAQENLDFLQIMCKDYKNAKKLQQKFDKSFLECMKRLASGQINFNNHLFYVPKTKCRNSESPY